MIHVKYKADAYSSPRTEVLEMEACEALLQGSSIPLEGGTPGSDLIPGGDYTI